MITFYFYEASFTAIICNLLTSPIDVQVLLIEGTKMNAYFDLHLSRMVNTLHIKEL